MQKKHKKNHKLKKVARAHTVISVIVFGVYVLSSVIYSPEFLLSDMRAKWSALADDTVTIIGRVLDSPKTPVLSGSAVCSNGTLSVNLDWADDENSQTFEVTRDSLPLVTGLTNSQYQDNAVVIGTTYAYSVTAHGPMGPGFAVSNEISITTPNECAVVIIPTAHITAFDLKDVSSYVGTPETNNRRPVFSGTTNIPNAIVSILIPNSLVISAETTANLNGYWSWQPPLDMTDGNYTIFVTVKDPLDLTRTASTNLSFIISTAVANNPRDKDHDNKHKASPVAPTTPTNNPPKQNVPPTQSPIAIPLAFSLTLDPTTVFQGRAFLSTIHVTNLAAQYDGASASVQYKILDTKNNVVMELTDKNVLRNGENIYKNIALTDYIKDGKYSLQTEIIVAGFNVSRSANFTVVPVPIIKLGGGFIITYPEVLSAIGNASLILFLLMIIWLFVFSREYWLYLHAARHITENNLRKAGLLGAKRRGVSH